ncbi:ion transporter [Alteromonas sp. ASW11-19]|uniref:Ion transporter n=1 Tax=Alteromonas salexigens TaxID=2982530 RepID=A0ABT2VJT6_9ALTE|nr:ion transporter [Alteromonas salexigens]MCU7553491.1 ion transporter [Alteromonas salexigens]
MDATSYRQACFKILRPYRVNMAGEWPSRLFDYFLIILILANVLALMLETVDSIASQWATALFTFELASVIFFTLEYVARVWVSPEMTDYDNDALSDWQIRWRYMRSPMAIIDLLAILPFFLSLVVTMDLRMLRLFRLTRMVKLGRYSQSMHTLMTVLRNEARTLLAAVSVLFIVMVFAATGIYYIERDVQPEVFSSIPAALWWSLVTLTTVGYGDVVPVSPLGRMFGGLITLLGVGLYALPAGILSSSFTAQLQRRRDRFRECVESAIADGHISDHESNHLEKVRDLLDLDEEEAEMIVKLLRHHHEGQRTKQEASTPDQQ